MKAIINARIYDFVDYLEDRYVLFDGTIVKTGPMSEFTGGESKGLSLFKGLDGVWDARGALLMPGLVLGHTHLYSAFARGWPVPFSPKSFRDILDQVWWKLDAGLDLEAVYYSGLVGGLELARRGVTTLIDHHASGSGIRGSLDQLKRAVCDELGLRGIFCFETSDRFPLHDCIEENLAFAAAYPAFSPKPAKAAGLFGLHASLSLDDGSLARIAEESRDLPVHVHVSESRDDEADAQKRSGLSALGRFDRAGLLRPDSLVAHGIHLSDADLDLAAERGLRLALNPSSNMNNGVGLVDYPRVRERGIPAMLGNDGLGSNFGREMQNFVFAQHHRRGNPVDVGLEDLRTLLLNSYDYAGRLLGCKLGRIQAGYESDFFLADYRAPTPMDGRNAFGHFFYGLLEDLRPSKVWCGGHLVVNGSVVYGSPPPKDGMLAFKVSTQGPFDLDSVYSQARKVAEKLWKRIV